MKVRKTSWDSDAWFEVIADRRRGSYPGFHNDGYVNSYGDEEGGAGWERYVEAKPKTKLEAYIVFHDGCNGTLEFGEIPGIKSTVFKGAIAPRVYRVPQFDCEIEG